MQILWSLGDGLVYDIIGQMPDPKPKYSTVGALRCDRNLLVVRGFHSFGLIVIGLGWNEKPRIFLLDFVRFGACCLI